MPHLPYLALAAMAVLAVVQIASHHDEAFSWFVLTAVSVAAAWFLAIHSTGRGTPFGDFDKAYYPAGRVVLAAPARLYDCAHPDGLCFVNLPIVALLFSPLSVGPVQTAHVIFTIAGVAAAGVVVLAGGVAAFIDLTRRRRTRAGALLGAAALLKPPFLIWLLYFLIRRQWNAAAAMGTTILTAAATSIAFFGLPDSRALARGVRHQGIRDAWDCSSAA